MILNLSKSSGGAVVEVLDYTPTSPCILEAADCMNRNNTCAMTMVICPQGTEMQSTSMINRQGVTIAQGSSGAGGLSLIYTGDITIGAGEMIRAIFLNTDAADLLRFNVKVRKA